MSRKKRNKGYQTAVVGAKGTVKILVYVCLIFALIFVGKTTYSFGYSIFNEKPMDKEGEGKDITVVIPSDSNIQKISKILEDKGIIEDSKIFVVQAKLSKHKDDLKPGTYILNTSKTADEILAILAKVDVEGQPTEEDTKKATEDSSVFDKVDSVLNGEESDSTKGETQEDTQNSGDDEQGE